MRPKSMQEMVLMLEARIMALEEKVGITPDDSLRILSKVQDIFDDRLKPKPVEEIK